ncbi:904_t:CDS:2 [Paraglomus occultum]|uniref:904_t:CDS:1 n=1 Tax=Paraglomus occultum TaxID=144539 RepID=A0A9N8VYH5_9GLOM|nr:904_t:CDS:2 [Paraglomus occultum]
MDEAAKKKHCSLIMFEFDPSSAAYNARKASQPMPLMIDYTTSLENSCIQTQDNFVLTSFVEPIRVKPRKCKPPPKSTNGAVVKNSSTATTIVNSGAIAMGDTNTSISNNVSKPPSTSPISLNQQVLPLKSTPSPLALPSASSPAISSNKPKSSLSTVPVLSNQVSNLFMNETASQISLTETKRAPRPPNAFILYRQHTQPSIIKQEKKLKNAEISRKLAQMWKNEPDHIKLHWQRCADKKKLEHMKKYPGYKYKPSRPGTNSNCHNDMYLYPEMMDTPKIDPTAEWYPDMSMLSLGTSNAITGRVEGNGEMHGDLQEYYQMLTGLENIGNNIPNVNVANNIIHASNLSSMRANTDGNVNGIGVHNNAMFMNASNIYDEYGNINECYGASNEFVMQHTNGSAGNGFNSSIGHVLHNNGIGNGVILNFPEGNGYYCVGNEFGI